MRDGVVSSSILEDIFNAPLFVHHRPYTVNKYQMITTMKIKTPAPQSTISGENCSAWVSIGKPHLIAKSLNLQADLLQKSDSSLKGLLATLRDPAR